MGSQYSCASPNCDAARVYQYEVWGADKLSGAWGRHPLLGRMYLPAYRAGTEKVAELRRRYAAEKVLLAIYGCKGLVDIVTVDEALAG